MSETGDRALSGDWEKISAFAFEMAEDMTMEFEGQSCNILDSEGMLVEKIGQSSAKKDVLAGYRCYVIRARVKFAKKSA